jgi:hypothetical protein
MTAMRTRPGIVLALLLVLGATTSLPSAAMSAADRFTFARPPAPESTVDPKSGRLSVDIDRWSTALERDSLVAAIGENGPEKLLDAFRDVGRIGTLYWPGGLEYAVRYAWRSQRADGGADVILVVDRPVWMWWDSSAPSTPYPYTVVQMKLAKDGSGEGRVSLGVSVASDKTLGVALSDFAKAPALLADVRRESAATH